MHLQYASIFHTGARGGPVCHGERHPGSLKPKYPRNFTHIVPYCPNIVPYCPHTVHILSKYCPILSSYCPHIVPYCHTLSSYYPILSTYCPLIVPYCHILSTYRPHIVHTLSTYCPHIVHILSTRCPQIIPLQVIPELDAPAHVGAGWEAAHPDFTTCVNKEPWTDWYNPDNPQICFGWDTLWDNILYFFQGVLNLPVAS